MMKNIVLLYVLFSFMIILNCSSQKNRRTDGPSLLDERKREIEAVLKLNKPVLLVKQTDIKSSVKYKIYLCQIQNWINFL